ncbi:acetoacetate--CoA ligase [Sphaerisporangium perillae]|uniref:acetoacetate--CoA ligase n=1 Tax=Sphaerisporangium perillae TaxID=2935860 RepID=UPI00200E80B8|nr:acetoacetate--CoA ligase [Sphaerisporangium perillae]
MTPGQPLYVPPPDLRRTTRIGHYLGWLEENRGLTFSSYDELHRWSVTDLDGFWSSIWDHFQVRAHTPPRRVLGRREMPGAEWFPGATLNYAEHALRSREAAPHEVAVVAHSQTRPPVELSWGQLADQVARARAGLRRLGVGRGDRVVAYLPSIPETLVAFLATASLGAVWASCAPEFGAAAVVDRFSQIEPTVLLAVTGYSYGAKDIDRRDDVAAVRAGLPTVRHAVHVPYGPGELPDTVRWDDLLAGPGDPGFEPVPFAHPLCVLFSSGTTGKPKPIVHGHGGILLEHLKNHALSWDLGPGDRLLWFSTTAWMIWNALVSGLVVGASIVMIDGNPLYPGLDWQWQLAEETGATLLGASPGFLMACRKEGLTPRKDHDLSRLRQIGAAGSPLPAEGYYWVHEQFGPDVLLNVGSGGTDVCSGLVQGGPWQPVIAGEISAPCLGVAAAAFDERGRAVVDELGELVVTEPMPSMPVGFWGDTDGSRYHAAYFDTYPGVWKHGDWVRFAPQGNCVIAGRSDATLNRGGVRLGTAEFYRVIEELPQIDDSLVIHLEDPAGGPGELLLYVVLRDSAELDEALRRRIAAALRGALSPRHVPDSITAIPAIPRNRTGKKLELPAKRILLGAEAADVASRDALADPASLDPFVAEAAARRAAR